MAMPMAMASRHSPSPWAKKKVSLHTIIKEATVSLAGKSDSVEKLLVRATAYMRQGDLTPQGLIYFNKAVEDYTHVIRVAEADGEAVREATFNRGKAHQQLSMVEEAIHDFDTVLSLDASPSWVTVNAAYCRASCHNIQGNFDEAIKGYELALENDHSGHAIRPRNSFSSLSTSAIDTSLDNKQQEGKFAEEEEHWREQRDGSDDDDEEYTNLSVQLSTIAEASEEDDPDSPDKFTHSRRALLAAEEPLASGMRACQARDFETAIRCFQRCLSINPKHFKAHFNKGFALHQLGRIDEAIESYTQALSFDTQSAFCYYNRGIARDRKGELQPAVLDFTRAITLCQEGVVPPNFYHNRGYSFSKLGRYDEALQDYDHAIALNPSHFRSYINRALAVEQLAGRETNEGRRTEALEKCVLDYTRALQLRPQSVVTLEARSLVLQKLEQFKVALKDITNAIKLTQKQRDANSASQISDAGGRETQKRTADKISLLLTGLIKTRALFWVKLGRIELEKEAGDGRDAKAALAMRARALEELTAALDVVFRIGGATGGEGRGGICLLAEQQCNAVGSLYYERGQVLVNLDRMAEAALDFTSALTYYISHHTEAYFQIMQSSWGVLAIPLLELPPAEPSALPRVFGNVAEAVRNLLVARAAVFQGTGYLSQAIVDYSAVLRLAAHHPPGEELREADMRVVTIATMVNRAYIYAKQGNHKRACRDYAFVITLDPDNVHAYFNRGVCCDKSQSYREAVDDFTKVIYMTTSSNSQKRSVDANKLHTGAYRQRGKAFASLGRQDLADKDRAKAAKLEAFLL